MSFAGAGISWYGGIMEPVRFADILFILLTLIITCVILWMVNKAKKTPKKSAENQASDPSKTL